MKGLMKSVALICAFMLLMHSVVPHIHHRHMSAAEIEINEFTGTDLLSLLSKTFHSNHAPKDLEELQPSAGETPTIPPMTLALLAEWASVLTIPNYELPATPVYFPETALPVINHFTGSLIISRPPPTC